MNMDRATFESFKSQGYNRIPVVREVLADTDTPLSTYLKLGKGPHSYFFESIQGGEKWGRFSIQVDDYEFILEGEGHSDLTLTHDEDIVLRKSNFTCPRTISVKCDKASDLVPREMVSKLQNSKTKGLFVITVD